jgi:hypothetical protein
LTAITQSLKLFLNKIDFGISQKSQFYEPDHRQVWKHCFR